jgi:hypothetical protein
MLLALPKIPWPQTWKRSRDGKFRNTKEESTGYGSVSTGKREFSSDGMINYLKCYRDCVVKYWHESTNICELFLLETKTRTAWNMCFVNLFCDWQLLAQEQLGFYFCCCLSGFLPDVVATYCSFLLQICSGGMDGLCARGHSGTSRWSVS